MEEHTIDEKGTLCDECRELGFCFRCDLEALRKWHEDNFILDVNKIKRHIPIREKRDYTFGEFAERQRMIYQNMYDAFHQEEYTLSLEYANEIYENYNTNDSWLMCVISSHYFLGNYQFVYDEILSSIDTGLTAHRNSLLNEILIDCKNKLKKANNE